jgi:hypothetical protein
VAVALTFSGSTTEEASCGAKRPSNMTVDRSGLDGLIRKLYEL